MLNELNLPTVEFIRGRGSPSREQKAGGMEMGILIRKGLAEDSFCLSQNPPSHEQ